MCFLTSSGAFWCSVAKLTVSSCNAKVTNRKSVHPYAAADMQLNSSLAVVHQKHWCWPFWIIFRGP